MAGPESPAGSEGLDGRDGPQGPQLKVPVQMSARMSAVLHLLKYTFLLFLFNKADGNPQYRTSTGTPFLMGSTLVNQISVQMRIAQIVGVGYVGWVVQVQMDNCSF